MTAIVRIIVLALLLALVLPAKTATGAEGPGRPETQGTAVTNRPVTAGERPLALDDAIHMALAKNDDIVIERESLASARAAVSGARGAYDPLLEVQGSWLRSTEPANASFSGASVDAIAPEFESAQAGLTISQLLPTGGALALRASGGRSTNEGPFVLISPAWNTQVGVELRQPLLRNLTNDEARLSVRMARAGRRGATASLRRTLNETIAAVERAYWDLAAARMALGVREESVRLAEEQLDETRTRVGSGAVPQTELAQPRAELERRRGELLAAREAAARANNALKLLILDDADETSWLTAIAPVDSPAVDAGPVDAARALQRALTERPELDAAEAVVESRRAETAFAHNAEWPSLDAVVSYDRYGLAGSHNPAAASDGIPESIDGDLGQSFETLRDGGFHAARVALVLGLPIRNRTAHADATIARHVERQAEADLSRTRKAIRAEVLDAVAALETAGQRVAAARSSREAAEIQLDAERDRYASGLSTNFLVLTRQNDLSHAQLDEISALTDYRKARAEMARATGRLVEGHGIDVGGTER